MGAGLSEAVTSLLVGPGDHARAGHPLRGGADAGGLVRQGVAVVVSSVVVINARLTLYAAALEPQFRRQPRWFRWLAPHFVVDQTFALATARDDLTDPVRFRRYWLSLGGLLGFVFVSLVATGAALGPRLASAGSALAFAPAALFLGLLVPRLTDRPGRAAAGAGAVVTGALLLIGGAPTGTPVLLGALSGIAAAGIVQRRGA